MSYIKKIVFSTTNENDLILTHEILLRRIPGKGIFEVFSRVICDNNMDIQHLGEVDSPDYHCDNCRSNPNMHQINNLIRINHNYNRIDENEMEYSSTVTSISFS